MYALSQPPATVERRESHRANQVDALSHTPATGGEEERAHRANSSVCAQPPSSYSWIGERVIEPIKCMHLHHTPATGGEEDRSHRANQVDVLRHTPARGGEERVIEPIKVGCSLATHQLQVERRENHRANSSDCARPHTS